VNLQRKIQGYGGFKGTAIVRLHINADKFTQGRIILFVYPNLEQGGYDPVGAGDTTGFFLEDHQYITQQLSVEIDVNTQSEAILEIPYRTPLSYYDLRSDLGSMGSVYLRTLLPIEGTAVNWTLSVAFKDAVLYNPTVVAGTYTQGSFVTKQLLAEEDIPKQNSTNKGLKRANSESAENKTVARSKPGSKSFQKSRHVMRDLKTRDIYTQSMFEAPDPTKPISSRLDVGHKVATILEGIPLLTSIMQPCKWALSIGSNVASAFGYSKPLDETSSIKTIEIYTPGYNNSDGVDNAQALALTAAPQVRVADNLGFTAQDEQSIAYLTQVKSSLTRTQWFVSGMPAGYKILEINCSPASFASRTQWGPTALNSPLVTHPIFYLSRAFSYWRGSFEFTIVLSKTIFHSGRIMVAYEPNLMAPYRHYEFPIIVDIDDCNNLQKQIIDIRDGNEFTIRVPYSATRPYMRNDETFGKLHIFVETPLVRNDTNVNDKVDIMLYGRGLDDWEFQGLRQPEGFPYYIHRPEPTRGRETTVNMAPKVLTQSSFDSGPQALETNNQLIVDTFIGKTTKAPVTTYHAERVFGEKITSVKQLAMKQCPVAYADQTPAIRRMTPNVFAIDTVLPTGFITLTAQRYFDWFSYVGNMFFYHKGGVILTVENRSAGDPVVAILDHVEKEYSGPFTDQLFPMCHRAAVGALKAERFYIPSDVSANCMVRHHSAFMHPDEAVDGNPTQTGHAVAKSKFYVTDAGPKGYVISRGAADDHQFGMFVGAPYMHSVRTTLWADNFAAWGNTAYVSS
jgi:hypothetical protein